MSIGPQQPYPTIPPELVTQLRRSLKGLPPSLENEVQRQHKLEQQASAALDALKPKVTRANLPGPPYHVVCANCRIRWTLGYLPHFCLWCRLLWA